MNTRERELNGALGAYSIDEYSEMDGYTVYDSTREYLEQQALANAKELADGNKKAGRIVGVIKCKNGNILLLVRPIGSTEPEPYFLEPAALIAISGGLVKATVTTDEQGFPKDVQLVDEQKELFRLLKDRRLLILDGKPFKIAD